MKKTVLILLFVPLIVPADLSVSQIKNMVSKIHQKREGISLSTLETTKAPFVKVVKENNVMVMETPKIEEVNFTLHAILNGKAYINDGWKRLDDNVTGYTVKYIGSKGVVLRNKNEIRKLFLKKEREKIFTIEEGN
ncbi:MAG: Unknown protein [uncultured Sulfurovum sp.]|uniref:Uncharacterized protein n=1 Tax=uncultured Sulfurovum sp. TaxID=269237 RepID=A0A6S6UEQ6_9BACT|nr:MAG: Unknown protein [uncultured Sulfurovum sp.]